MILIATLVVALAIIAVTGTAIALHLKPLNGRTRSERHKMGTVRRWISELLTSAIIGAFGALLINFLASRIVPEYWSGLDPWGVAGTGAVGAMATRNDHPQEASPARSIPPWGHGETNSPRACVSSRNHEQVSRSRVRQTFHLSPCSDFRGQL
jgi:hypothetical protein